MASSSASVRRSTGVVFQLLASLLSFFTINGITGAAAGTWLAWLKLDLAAVDATDWAIDGTVSWARREEGRPDFTGTALALAAGAGAGAGGLVAVTFTGGLTLVSAATGAVLAGIALGSGFTMGVLALRVSVVAAFADATAAFLVFAVGFTTGLAGASLDAAFAAGLTGGAAVACFCAAPAPALLAFTSALAGFDAGVDAFGAGFFAAAALAGVALAVLAFTICLLTETLWAWLKRGVAFVAKGVGAPGPSARECTGIPKGKPIICNSVTNIV